MNQYGPLSTCRYEVLGAVTGTTTGTTVTAGGGAGTKGSWVSFGTSAFAYEQISLMAVETSGTTQRGCIFDIGISDGTNTWVLAGDLYVNPYQAEMNFQLDLPLHVPSGSQLQVRYASSTASSTAKVLLRGCSVNVGGAPGFSKLSLLSVIASGVATAAAGGNNAKSRTQIVASSATPASALLFIYHHQGVTRSAVDLEYGAASSEAVILPRFAVYGGSSLTSMTQCVRSIVIPCAFPAGTRFSVNIANSAGSNSGYPVLYGFQ